MFMRFNAPHKVSEEVSKIDKVFRIADLRKKAGVSQAELAQRMGYRSSATIAMWETANREPDLATIRKIADYFNVSIEELVNDDIELGYENYTLKSNARFDEEIISLRNMLHSRPEMQMLFSVSKSASKEDIEKAIRIIEALKQS